MSSASNKTSGQEPADSDIPKTPPMALRSAYLQTSRGYVWWCIGLLAWTLLCIGYFLMTGKRDNLYIGLFLGMLVIAMTVLPPLLFGGETWYKRLGWITILLVLFSAMFLYPTIMIVVGTVGRILQHRYTPWPIYSTDRVHAMLGLFTIATHVWTILLTIRAVRLVRKLGRGEFGEMDVRVRR